MIPIPSIRDQGLPFIYLVQTESCLPSTVSSVDVIGNSTACQCDVVVLSFQKECHEKPPEHITYIYSPSSWNEGRNLLFKVAMKRERKYLYYNFMDDDLTLKVEGKVQPQSLWRAFEKFLIETEPAIASVHLIGGWISDIKAIRKSRKRLGCSLREETDNLPTPFYDPALNAFHHQAVEHILPYTTKFDNISWWWSGFYAGIKSEVMFPGQVVVHTEIQAISNKARPYPRKGLHGQPGAKKDWKTIYSGVKADLPQRYRDVPLFNEWVKHGPVQHFYKSWSLCLPPPRPHMLIKPFAYLEN